MDSLLESSKLGVAPLSSSALYTPASFNLEALFAEIGRALEEQDLGLALRLSDRARRIAPGNAACALLYARILIKAGLARDALAYLNDDTNPDMVLARGTAYLQQELFAEAVQCCASLLQRYCVDAVEGLSAFAAEVVERGGLPGWIGVNRDLKLVGAVTSGSASILASVAELDLEEVTRASDRMEAFRGSRPLTSAGPMLAVVDSGELAGSGLAWPPALGAAGWVIREGVRISGEVVVDWAPRLPVIVEISFAGAEGVRSGWAYAEKNAVECAFAVDLNAEEAQAARINVAAVLPGGSRMALVGSPVVARDERTRAARLRKRSAGHRSGKKRSDVVDIIVPVYAGKQETLDCLQSLFRTTSQEIAEIVVVNDASPDEELVSALADLAAANKITLLTNETNLGYAGSTNRGLRLHADRDVVLLNADTEVFGDWLERLASAAVTAGDIGTVTPLGQGGSITDYGGSSARPRARAQEVDGLARRANASTTVEVPVGVGFCMYVKRSCLEETGELDGSTYVRGYGEENDFCLRARRRGWRHVAATDVFVRHHGGRSFGEEARLLRKRNGRVLNAMHPGYESLIESFSTADPLLASRRAIDIERLKRAAGAFVLLITHDLRGGVSRHVHERRSVLEGEGHTTLLLEPYLEPYSGLTPGPGEALADRGAEQARVKLTVEAMKLEDLVFAVPEELPLLTELLQALSPGHVEMHHFVRLPAEVFELVGRLQVPYDVYLHDYSWVCPRLCLMDGSGRYCGEPSVDLCEQCIARNGSGLEERLTVRELRDRSSRFLGSAREVFVPTVDALARYTRYFPGLAFTTMPWETASNPAEVRAAKRAGRLRVGVLGAIGKPKGYELLLECARDAAGRDLDVEFVVIGYTSDDRLLQETNRVFVTGPYFDQEAHALLEREECGVVLCPSVVPETWCYSLSHAIRFGVPIVAFDLGAQAERLRGYPTARLLQPSASAAEVNASLLEVASAADSLLSDEKTFMEQELPKVPESTQDFISRNLMSSVEVLKLPQGIYSFSIKDGGSTTGDASALVVPALQVGVAPVRTAGKVEFLTAGSALDRWLAFASDRVIVRILGGDASVSLTSVYTANSVPLAVDVKRLHALGPEANGHVDLVHDQGGQVSRSLPAHMLAHLRYVGDLDFEGSRAGWPGQNMWMEGFAIRSIEGIPPHALEYCGLVANGFQTPWLRAPTFCGSRGGGLPLLGFAVRIHPQWQEQWECGYSGGFLSGARVGPLTGGGLCISGTLNDPLESVEFFVRDRKPD